MALVEEATGGRESTVRACAPQRVSVLLCASARVAADRPAPHRALGPATRAAATHCLDGQHHVIFRHAPPLPVPRSSSSPSSPASPRCTHFRSQPYLRCAQLRCASALPARTLIHTLADAQCTGTHARRKMLNTGADLLCVGRHSGSRLTAANLRRALRPMVVRHNESAEFKNILGTRRFTLP